MRAPRAFWILALAATPALALDPPARFDCWPNLCGTQPPPVVNIVPTTQGVCCGNLYGCVFRSKSQCIIYVSATLDAAARAAVLRHEFAHCALPIGWPASHPN